MKFQKTALVILPVLLVLLCGSVASAKVDPVELYIEAVMTRDTATLEKLLAANYLHINGNGYLQDKEHFIASLKNGKMLIDRLTITDVNASHYGDATMITGTVLLRGKFEPKLPQGLQRLTMVLEKKDGQNKIILFQATPVRKDSRNSEDVIPAKEKGRKGKAARAATTSPATATPAAEATKAPAAEAPKAAATPAPAMSPKAPATEAPKTPAAQ